MKKQFFTYLWRYLFRLLAVFAILLAVLSCTGGNKIASSGLGSASDPIPFTEKAITGVLPSGMRYYLLENTHPGGRARLTLAVNAGSVLETDEEAGLAHFVEHMAFNGTTRFPGFELVDYLRTLGMRIGPEINAFTNFDETVYRIDVPVEAGRRIPDRALAVIDDWSRNIAFDPEDVDMERLVIIEEYRQRMDAWRRIYLQQRPVLYRGSPYATERSAIGSLEVIESATPGQLRAFYEKWYKPENMALIIVGDFDAEYLESQLPAHFPAAASNVPFSRPRYNLSEPAKGNITSLVLTDDELPGSMVELYWKRKSGTSRQDLASYRESLIDNLANAMLNLRLEEAAVKSETPYGRASATMYSYGDSSRFYYLGAEPHLMSAEAALRALLLTKEAVSRHGFLQSELDIAKMTLASNKMQLAAEKDHRPSEDLVRFFTQHFLRNEPVPDPEWELEAVNRLIEGITLKEVNRAARNYFADDDLTILISAPEAEKASLPDDGRIRAIVAESRRAKIARPVAEKQGNELLSGVPVPGTIVSEQIDEETGAIRLMLSNGAEVILKETDNSSNYITMYALAKGGVLSVPPEATESAWWASEMVRSSGVGHHSNIDLVKILAGKRASAAFWASGFTRGFQGGANSQDIKTLFEMLYLRFTQPHIDKDVVEVNMDWYRGRYAHVENNPITYFSREIQRAIYGDPRYHPTTVSSMDNVRVEDAMDFVLRCVNPADYVFVFTGNMNLNLMRPLLQTYLASIPRGEAFDEWADFDPQRPLAIERDIYRGYQTQGMVHMGWFSPQAYSVWGDAVTSALSSYLFIQLNDKIREEMGGVYNIFSEVNLTPLMGEELFGGVRFQCDPVRSVELADAVHEEFLRIARGNIDADVLAKAIEALVQQHEQSMFNDQYIANSYANSAVVFETPLNRLEDRPRLVRTITAGDLQRTAMDLLRGTAVRFYLYPET